MKKKYFLYGGIGLVVTEESGYGFDSATGRA